MENRQGSGDMHDSLKTPKSVPAVFLNMGPYFKMLHSSRSGITPLVSEERSRRL